ncbi:MAG: tRNA 2-selenouridine(34) synthase MnmH [Bacteroidia bacterium]
MAILIDWEKFLKQNNPTERPLIDVRSPGEYALGYVPGAESMPIFNDDERAAVGTLFKQVGRDVAVRKGLEYIGPKMAPMVKQIDKFAPERKVAVHCWRGGMRSQSVASLLEMAGYDVQVIEGGYKAYRNLILEYMGKPWKLKVLSGRTGSGKTDILLAMKAKGQQVIDLEGLAHHKGSAFGGLMQAPQPTQQNFEHALFEALRACDPNKPIWLEDESVSIGKVAIPQPLWKQKLVSPITLVDMPTERRVKRLVHEYSNAPVEGIRKSVNGISRRLGGQRVNQALEALEQGNFAEGTRISLHYYDSAYDKGLAKKKEFVQHTIACEEDSIEVIADRVIAK